MKEPQVKFPVILKTEVLREPRTTIYYEVAANGIFQVRDTPGYRAVTLAELPIPGLLPESESLRLRFPRLPAPETERTLAFFEQVYRCYQGEAIVIIFYRPERRKFKLGVPPQTPQPRRRLYEKQGRSLGVTYAQVERPNGYLRLGTIHSHGGSQAFFSDTDCADEQFEDGLHVVFGNFGSDHISVAAAFVANGIRFALEPGAVLESYGLPSSQPPAGWMEKVKYGRDPESEAGVVSVLPEVGTSNKP